MADKYELKALITAVDRLSPVLNKINRNLGGLQRQFKRVGGGAKEMSIGLAASLAIPARAFAGLESSAVNLQNVLMDKNGNIPKVFEAINAEAIKLGTELPGSTEDMNRMAASLKSLGVSGESIANGVLRSSAYLAVVGKDVDVTYKSASEAVGKLGKGFKIADQDMVSFTDSLQRSMFSGSVLEELHFAMSKVSGELEVWGKQGLKVANATLPLVSIFTSRGFSGEEAGTGLKSIIHEAGKSGNLKSIENMVAALDKINHLPDKIRSARLEKLFGKEHAGKAALITLENYHRQVEAMANQGSLMDKIANSTGTLENKVESAAGTWTNFMASFGGAYSSQLKDLVDKVNSISDAMSQWALKNGDFILDAIKVAGAFVGLKAAAMVAAAGVGILNTAMKMNPLMLLVQGIALAAPLIYENWDAIVDRFKKGIDRMVEFFQPLIDMIKWVGRTLSFVWDTGKFIGGSVGKLLPGMPDLSVGGGPGMRPPGYQRPNIVGSQRISGAIDVNFNNTPPGTRVAPASNGPVVVNPNVGYRTIGTMLP